MFALCVLLFAAASHAVVVQRQEPVVMGKPKASSALQKASSEDPVHSMMIGGHLEDQNPMQLMDAAKDLMWTPKEMAEAAVAAGASAGAIAGANAGFGLLNGYGGKDEAKVTKASPATQLNQKLAKQAAKSSKEASKSQQQATKEAAKSTKEAAKSSKDPKMLSSITIDGNKQNPYTSQRAMAPQNLGHPPQVKEEKETWIQSLKRSKLATAAAWVILLVGFGACLVGFEGKETIRPANARMDYEIRASQL